MKLFKIIIGIIAYTYLVVYLLELENNSFEIIMSAILLGTMGVDRIFDLVGHIIEQRIKQG